MSSSMLDMSHAIDHMSFRLVLKPPEPYKCVLVVSDCKYM